MQDLENYTDNQLLALLCRGDAGAYKVIYERYIFTLLNHAYNKTRNREEAKDIVQEVFTRLWHKKASLQNVGNLSGYLYTSVQNIILNQFAHKSVQHRYIASMLKFAEQEAVITDHQVRERQFMAIIEREIALLPPKMREVFELSRKQHFSHQQIADQLNISEQTVSKHITNALKILRLRLGIILYICLIIHP